MQLDTVALLLLGALQPASALYVSRSPAFSRFPSSLSCPVGRGRTVFIKDQEIYHGFRHNVRQASGTITEFFASTYAHGVAVSMKVAVDVGDAPGHQDRVTYNSGSAHTKFGPCNEHGDVKSS